MKKYITPNHVLIYLPDHDAAPETALAVAGAEEQIYVSPTNEYVVAAEAPAGCLDVTTRPNGLYVVNDGAWVLPVVTAPEMAPTPIEDGVVSTTRFLRELLTLPIYGSMEVAEVGLSAKFAAGHATETDIQLLGMFRAAKAWLNSATSLNLNDPMVSQVLDACIAIPQIGLTLADKERILRNEVSV